LMLARLRRPGPAPGGGPAAADSGGVAGLLGRFICPAPRAVSGAWPAAGVSRGRRAGVKVLGQASSETRAACPAQPVYQLTTGPASGTSRQPGEKGSQLPRRGPGEAGGRLARQASDGPLQAGAHPPARPRPGYRRGLTGGSWRWRPHPGPPLAQTLDVVGSLHCRADIARQAPP
jgi:hypothetical protein